MEGIIATPVDGQTIKQAGINTLGAQEERLQGIPAVDAVADRVIHVQHPGGAGAEPQVGRGLLDVDCADQTAAGMTTSCGGGRVANTEWAAVSDRVDSKELGPGAESSTRQS